MNLIEVTSIEELEQLVCQLCISLNFKYLMHPQMKDNDTVIVVVSIYNL